MRENDIAGFVCEDTSRWSMGCSRTWSKADRPVHGQHRESNISIAALGVLCFAIKRGLEIADRRRPIQGIWKWLGVRGKRVVG